MKVKDLFIDKSKWTKQALARDRYGDKCTPVSPSACSFCLLGAIERMYDLDEIQEIINKVQAYLTDDIAISFWNDHIAAFEDVKKLVDELNI